MKVRYRKHRTARSIARQFFGHRPEDLRVVDQHGESHDLVAAIEREGIWAFVETRKKPPIIHWWDDDKRTVAECARVLGHELGHISGKPKKGITEEWRADEYADVVVEVIRRLKLENDR